MKECFECGCPATEDHHVIPQSLGGTKTIPLCGTCHERVHDAGWKRRDNHKELTIEGLKRAKERGVKLGNPTNLAEAGQRGATATKAKALAFAQSVQDVVVGAIRELGTLYKAAEFLNEANVQTSRGGKWTVQSLSNLLMTLEISIADLRKPV